MFNSLLFKIFWAIDAEMLLLQKSNINIKVAIEKQQYEVNCQSYLEEWVHCSCKWLTVCATEAKFTFYFRPNTIRACIIVLNRVEGTAN